MKKTLVLLLVLCLFATPVFAELDIQARILKWSDLNISYIEMIKYKYYNEPRNAIVAILDTGVDASHPYLKDRVVAEFDIINNDNDTNSSSASHGTAVAGIINSSAYGLAQSASLVSVRVFDKRAYLSYMCRGINKVLDEYPDQPIVFNISNDISEYTANEMNAFKNVMQRCKERHNVLFICAAGNSNSDLDMNENKQYPASFTYDFFICVGASELVWNQGDDLAEINWHSSRVCEFSNYGKESVDVFAPGFEIETTYLYHQTRKFSGTSLSAPIVAALAANIWGVNSSLTALEVKDIILSTADPVDEMNDKKSVTNARVNFYSAMKKAIGEPVEFDYCYKGIVYTENRANNYVGYVAHNIPHKYFADTERTDMSFKDYETMTQYIDNYIKQGYEFSDCDYCDEAQ